MNQKLIAEIGKSQRLQILNKLKRTQGLSVSELAEKIGMSYMGVKQHCIDLHKGGYLDTWRRPKPVGRPEMVYRLTQRAHELFPSTSNALTIGLLESSLKLYGPAAAEKLLFNVFQRSAESYLARLKGNTVAERARSLTKLRDNEGHMAEYEENGSLRIVEHHSPILDLLRAFPIVARLELEMFQRVLKVPVRREEQAVSGLYQCIFHLESDSSSALPPATTTLTPADLAIVKEEKAAKKREKSEVKTDEVKPVEAKPIEVKPAKTDEPPKKVSPPPPPRPPSAQGEFLL